MWPKETKISKPTYRSRKLTRKQDTIIKQTVLRNSVNPKT